ncbi:unnamed protein product, partial [Phaeothamnion confervicola]
CVSAAALLGWVELSLETSPRPWDGKGKGKGKATPAPAAATPVYYNVLNGCLSRGIDPKLLDAATRYVRGGILADEMGLGKTVEVLGCILANRKEPHKEREDKGTAAGASAPHKEAESSDGGAAAAATAAQGRKQPREEPGHGEDAANRGGDGGDGGTGGGDSGGGGDVGQSGGGGGGGAESMDSEGEWQDTPAVQELLGKETADSPGGGSSGGESSDSEEEWQDTPAIQKKGSTAAAAPAANASAAAVAIGDSDNDGAGAETCMNGAGAAANSTGAKKKQKTAAPSKSAYWDDLSAKENEMQACLCGRDTTRKADNGWVFCTACERWLHTRCAGFASMAEAEACESFTCVLCRCRAFLLIPAESGATLIVCPAVILGQWTKEIEKHTQPGALKVLVYPGAREAISRAQRACNGGGNSGEHGVRDAMRLLSPDFLASHDIVLTTFEALRADVHHSESRFATDKWLGEAAVIGDGSGTRNGGGGNGGGGNVEDGSASGRDDDGAAAAAAIAAAAPAASNGKCCSVLRYQKRYQAVPSPLPAVRWWRVALDEAQMVEATTADTARMALRLPAVHRWCVSGTPIGRGAIEDLYGLLSFLQAKPFNVRALWQHALQAPVEARLPGAMKRLTAVLGGMLWRTSKRSVLDQLGLPPQNEVVRSLRFSSVEMYFYKRQHGEVGTAASKVLGSKNNAGLKKLGPLVRVLRQACCHPQVGGTGAIRAGGRGKVGRHGTNSGAIAGGGDDPSSGTGGRGGGARATGAETSRGGGGRAAGRDGGRGGGRSGRNGGRGGKGRKGGRGRGGGSGGSDALHVLSMDQIHDKLIAEARLKCTDELRAVLLNINALAGVARCKAELVEREFIAAESAAAGGDRGAGGPGGGGGIADPVVRQSRHLGEAVSLLESALAIAEESRTVGTAIGDMEVGGSTALLERGRIVQAGERLQLCWELPPDF